MCGKLIRFIIYIGISLAVLLSFRTAKVVGNSMHPTLKSGDLLLLRTFGSVEYGDIIAVYSSELDKVLCKRVVALGGDDIKITSNEIYINQILISERYVRNKNWCPDDYLLEVTVPHNSVFVLGDNRVSSVDSRAFGCLPTSAILGTYVCDINVYVTIVLLVWLIFVFLHLFELKMKGVKGNER